MARLGGVVGDWIAYPAETQVILSMTADLPSITDFTAMFWWRVRNGNAGPGSGAQAAVSLMSGVGDFGAAYLQGGATAGQMFLYAWDGAGEYYPQKPAHTPFENQWLHCAFVKSGTTLSLYVTDEGPEFWDADLAAELTTTVSVTLAELRLRVNKGTAFREVRVWEAALSPAEIRLERVSSTAVRTAGLYSDTRFTDTSDLSDLSGGGHDWAITGHLIADNKQVGSVFNQRPPLEAGSVALTLPASVSLDAMLPTFGTYPLGEGYYATEAVTYTAQPGDSLISVIAHFAPIAGKSLSVLFGKIIDGNLVDLAKNLWLDNSNADLWHPLVAGLTYVFVFSVPTESERPLSGTLEARNAPIFAASAGDIIIPACWDYYPPVVLSQTNGDMVRTLPWRAAHVGIRTPDGYYCVGHGNAMTWPAWVAVYDSTLALVAEPAVDELVMQISHDGHSTFYVAGYHGSYANIGLSTVSTSGVVSYRQWELPASQVWAMAVSWDGATVYYTENSGRVPIKRYDLVGSVALADFKAAETLCPSRDILILADGSILVGYSTLLNTAGRTCELRRYDTAGNLLATYGPYFGLIDSIVVGNDDPDSFWVKIFNYPTIPSIDASATLYRIDTTSGATLVSWNVGTWTEGYEGPAFSETVDPEDVPFWGAPDSCPLLLVYGDIPGDSPSASPSTSASVSASASPSPEPPRLIRRMRQSPHLSDEQVNLFFAQFQIDFEAGTPREGLD